MMKGDELTENLNLLIWN